MTGPAAHGPQFCAPSRARGPGTRRSCLSAERRAPSFEPSWRSRASATRRRRLHADAVRRDAGQVVGRGGPAHAGAHRARAEDRALDERRRSSAAAPSARRSRAPGTRRRSDRSRSADRRPARPCRTRAAGRAGRPGCPPRLGDAERIRAATPVTCGAAIDVPSSQPQPGCGCDESPGSELRIATPRAPRCRRSSRRSSRSRRDPSGLSIAATETMLGRSNEAGRAGKRRRRC